MQQTERTNDDQEAIRAQFMGGQKNIWTALPGIVDGYDPVAGTCTVVPALQMTFTSSSGEDTQLTLQPMVDVPVVYMGGGNMVTTYPIQKGDEALIVFSSRCIDAWWQSGGVQPQAELRMHNLSDGFAIIGPRSLARTIPNVSTTTAQFRSLDGSTFFEVAPNSVANVVAPGGVNITGPVNIKGAVMISGNVDVTGTVTATEEGTFNGIEVSQHMHTGVTAGGGTSGPPVG
jgi:Phage protein Gp138 N-terminal domain